MCYRGHSGRKIIRNEDEATKGTREGRAHAGVQHWLGR